MRRGRKSSHGTPSEASRRAALLRSAAALFVAKGYAATTTRDIAHAAGMRAGSPFYHFRSKQELLRAAIADGLENGYQRLLAAISGVDDAEQRLRALIRAHLGNLLDGESGKGCDEADDTCPGTARDAPLLLYEFRSLDAVGRTEISAIMDRYQRPWQDTLDALAASNRLRNAKPPLRLLLLGMLNWTPQWYQRNGSLSLDAIADAVADLLLTQPPTANRR